MAYEEEKRTGEYEKPGPAKGHAYGVASVTNVMHGINFPISRQELINRFGHEQIFWTKNNPQKLEALLRQVPQEQFNNVTEITASIGKVVRAGKAGEVRR
jgi:hypothetical protein